MKGLLLFTGILALVLGILQIFYPKLLIQMDELLQNIFPVKKESLFDLRRVVGGILIIIGIILCYLATQPHYLYGKNLL